MPSLNSQPTTHNFPFTIHCSLLTFFLTTHNSQPTTRNSSPQLLFLHPVADSANGFDTWAQARAQFAPDGIDVDIH